MMGKEDAMHVVATQLGYYDDALRYPGDKFILKNGEKEFSPTWMKQVKAGKAPKASKEQKPKG
jgi:hypothetical protein